MIDTKTSRLHAAVAADAAAALAKRRAAGTWPARRHVDAANTAPVDAEPVSADEIDVWLDEKGAKLRAARQRRINDPWRVRLWGYGLVITLILGAAAFAAWVLRS